MKEDIKKRLIKHITFLQEELKDYSRFKQLTWKDYQTNRNERRNVERWIENLINSSIDIAKIILSSEGLTFPDTYREIIVSLSLAPGFDPAGVKKLSHWVRLRNIISHEYLDIRWTSIKRFIAETEPLYTEFLNRVRGYLEEGLSQID